MVCVGTGGLQLGNVDVSSDPPVVHVGRGRVISRPFAECSGGLAVVVLQLCY